MKHVVVPLAPQELVPLGDRPCLWLTPIAARLMIHAIETKLMALEQAKEHTA